MHQQHLWNVGGIIINEVSGGEKTRGNIFTGKITDETRDIFFPLHLSLPSAERLAPGFWFQLQSFKPKQ